MLSLVCAEFFPISHKEADGNSKPHNRDRSFTRLDECHVDLNDYRAASIGDGIEEAVVMVGQCEWDHLLFWWRKVGTATTKYHADSSRLYLGPTS